MEEHRISKRLKSYDINKELVENILQYLRRTLPGILSPDLSILEVDQKTSITIVHPSEAKKYVSVGDYPGLPFNNKIECLKIELGHVIKYMGAEKGIVLILSFSKERANSHLHMVLRDESAETKLSGIQAGLLSTLEHYKNSNSKVYRSELFSTFLLLIGIIVGTLTFVTKVQPAKSIFATIFGVCLYLVSFRYLKGYCTFDSARQKRMDTFFKWLTNVIAGAIFAAILSAIGKKLFTF